MAWLRGFGEVRYETGGIDRALGGGGGDPGCHTLGLDVRGGRQRELVGRLFELPAKLGQC